MFNTRFRVAALIFSMTNAVIFGAGLVTVLLIPRSRPPPWNGSRSS